MFYAANFWPKHGASCDFGDDQQYLIHRFFATRFLPGGGNYGAWILALFQGTDAASNVDAAVLEKTHPIYYAASFGMVPVVKAIITTDPDIDLNAPGGRVGATPVWIASLRFNFEVADILLQAGADPCIPDPGTGLNVLELSSWPLYRGLRPILAPTTR